MPHLIFVRLLLKFWEHSLIFLTNNDQQHKTALQNGVFPIIAPQLSGQITYIPTQSW